MYICLCKGIPEAQLLRILARPSDSCTGVMQSMGIDDECCGRCKTHLDEIVSRFSALRPV